DVATGQERATLRDHPMAWIFSVAFSPDGKTLASGNADTEVVLWDVATGQEHKRLTLGLKDETYVYHVAFSTDGTTLGSIEGGSTINLWDMASGENLASFDWDVKSPVDTFVDSAFDKLSIICKRHQGFAHWHSVFFGPNNKLLALGDRQLDDSRKRYYGMRLLEV